MRGSQSHRARSRRARSFVRPEGAYPLVKNCQTCPADSGGQQRVAGVGGGLLASTFGQDWVTSLSSGTRGRFIAPAFMWLDVPVQMNLTARGLVLAGPFLETVGAVLLLDFFSGRLFADIDPAIPPGVGPRAEDLTPPPIPRPPLDLFCGPELAAEIGVLVGAVAQDFARVGQAYAPTGIHPWCEAALNPFYLRFMGAWDILEFGPSDYGRIAYNNMLLALPGACAVPQPPCGDTVSVWGTCWNRQAVNYLMFGVLAGLCDRANRTKLTGLQAALNLHFYYRYVSTLSYALNGKGLPSAKEFSSSFESTEGWLRIGFDMVLPTGIKLFPSRPLVVAADTTAAGRAEKRCPSKCRKDPRAQIKLRYVMLGDVGPK